MKEVRSILKAFISLYLAIVVFDTSFTMERSVRVI